MKKYDNYKDSGIEWIGDVPNHWELKKIKHLGKILSGYSFKSDDFIDKEGCRVMKISNIQTMKLDWKDESFLPHSFYEKYSNFQVKKGDLVFALTRPIISSGIKASIIDIEDEILLNQRNAVLKPNEFLNVNWIYYLVFNPLFINHFESLIDNTGQQPNISSTDISNISIFLPPLLEQTAIANYLDHKTSQIDHLISKKEKFIKLLEEERVAVINQAVTKGLNPNVPMKDSGVEWLGEIPEHWEEARIKNIVKIIGRIGFRGYTTEDLVQKGEGAISLSPSNIKNHILNIDDCTYLSWDKYNESPEIKIFENDIILVKTGSTIGKTAIIPSGTPEMTLNPQLVVFKDIKLNPVFLYYMMISNYFQGYFNINTAGGSTPAISQEKINNFKITFPNIEEQTQISYFITKKESEIKSLITKAKQEIELLKEYKTALISEVVTGKVDVRNEILN